MPHLLPEKDIIPLINNGIIQNGKAENAEGVKYDFTLSSIILKAKYKTPIDINKLGETERASIFVEPGEVIFVLTQERLELPDNLYIVLVPKRKLSHDGIMVLGGLSVDPCYKGKLLIGLYNFSSSPYPIKPGRKVIGSHFFQLREDEIQRVKQPEASIDDFPENLVQLMGKYTPISTQSLLEKINTIDVKLETFKDEIRDSKDWFDKFQKRIEEQEENIDKLLDSLEKEKENRLKSDRDLENELKSFRTDMKEYAKSSYKIAAIIGTCGALLLSLLVWFLTTFVFNKNDRNVIPSATPVNNYITIDSTVLKPKG